MRADVIASGAKQSRGKCSMIAAFAPGLLRRRSFEVGYSRLRIMLLGNDSRGAHHALSAATPSISISIFGSGSACTTHVVRAG
ncbi:MAG: hypothetical protein QOF41_1193 [Methylobacteriaceae bacterium]|nr:hypothetical protein [Methylobacteriaceae bacterium]